MQSHSCFVCFQSLLNFFLWIKLVYFQTNIYFFHQRKVPLPKVMKRRKSFYFHFDSLHQSIRIFTVFFIVYSSIILISFYFEKVTFHSSCPIFLFNKPHEQMDEIGDFLSLTLMPNWRKKSFNFHLSHLHNFEYNFH